MAIQSWVRRGARQADGSSTSGEFPIPTGQTNAALGTTVASLGGVLVLLTTDLFDTLLGVGASHAARTTVVVAVLAVWTVVTCADLVARAYATAHQRRLSGSAGGGEPAAPATSQSPPAGQAADSQIVRVDDDALGPRLLAVVGDRVLLWRPVSEVSPGARPDTKVGLPVPSAR